MTNLTDEGLMFKAQKLTGSDCVCEDLKLLAPNDPICHLHKTFSVLQQVRDAAKKEEREACASVAHSFRKGNLSVGKLQDLLNSEPTTPINILPDGTIEGHDPAIVIATAIRQMEVK